nr:hypothetical protein [uncultured Holophaga sp.]
MINLLLGFVAGLVIFLVLALLKLNVAFALVLGLVGGVAVFFYLGKRLQGKLEEIFNRAGEQLKRQQFDPAIEIMKEGYQYAKWQFMVRGSIDGQIGIVQYIRKKNEEAEPLLRSAPASHYIAKCMLGILQWKRKENAAARETLEKAMHSAKKESLVYAIHAYVLMEMHERDKAIQVLNRGLGFCKGDDRLQSNLTLIQNNKPMKMKVYGEQWYQFLLERPMMRQEPPPYARVSKRAMRG